MQKCLSLQLKPKLMTIFTTRLKSCPSKTDAGLPTAVNSLLRTGETGRAENHGIW
jgi:hypothetical protein